MCLVEVPPLCPLRASCLWVHTTATLQTLPNTFPNILPPSLLLGEVRNFSAQPCWLAISLEKSWKTQTMHSFLMRWDNIGSREISAKCSSCVWHWWSPGRKGSALTSNTPFGWSRPYPLQMSMNLSMLWSTILQLPKCIFTQCSQISYAEKDLSFNYPT